MSSGVPQGKLGPWLFVIIVDDLSILDALSWKQLQGDDTIGSEIIPKGHSSSLQEYVDSGADWTVDNRFQLNIDKCKEIRISFSKNNMERLLQTIFLVTYTLTKLSRKRLNDFIFLDSLNFLG